MVTQSTKLVAIAIPDVIRVKNLPVAKKFLRRRRLSSHKTSMNQHTEPYYLPAKYQDSILSRHGGDKHSETSTITLASVDADTFTSQITQRGINND